MLEEAKKPTKILGISKNVLGMGAVSFLNDASSDMVFPFIGIFLTTTLGASAAFVGLVEGVADSTASILKIFSGRLSDKLRIRKPLIVFGYSLSAISKPILSLATSPWHVLIVRFFDRVGKGTRDAPRDALISVSTDNKDIGRAFGFHRAADTLGAAVGPILAAIILPFIDNDLRTLFLLSFIASFFAVLVLIKFVKEVDGHHVPVSAQTLKMDFKSLDVNFIIFLIATTIFSLGKTSEAFLLLRAQGLGVTLVMIPILYFIFNITLAAFSTPIGILSDKIGHRNSFMVGIFLSSIVYYLFGLADTGMVMWLVFFFFGIQAAFTEGVGRAIVADLVEEKLRATAYGLYNALNGIALLPASIIFGLLWDFYSPTIAFNYCATIGIIALIIFAFLRNNHHQLSSL